MDCGRAGSHAGGHHSYEDLHQPILMTYGSIRSQPNISLVAGSGFGDGEGVWPYITGECLSVACNLCRSTASSSTHGLWLQRRHTGDSIKQLLVQAPGVNDDR